MSAYLAISPPSEGNELSDLARESDPVAFTRQFFDRIEDSAAGTHSHLLAFSVGAVPDHREALSDFAYFQRILHSKRSTFVACAATGLAAQNGNPATLSALLDFASGLNRESDMLNRLILAIGTPRNRATLTEAESAVRAQCEAMLTLCRSEQFGCGLGAVAAFETLWLKTARILLRSAESAGLSASDVMALRTEERSSEYRSLFETLVHGVAENRRARRALLFGASQAIGLRIALWDLLEARAAIIC